MKILKITLLIIVILTIIVLAVYTYYGGFSKVEIRTEQQGGEIFVYDSMTGDYSRSGVYMDSIYHVLLNDYNTETYKGCGIYYDDPQNVEKENLRSEIGCILEPKDSVKIKEISNKYKIKTLPEGKYMVAEFPFKGTISIFVGMMKVYPALEKYYNENDINSSGPIMEIYDIPNGKIIYRAKM